MKTELLEEFHNHFGTIEYDNYSNTIIADFHKKIMLEFDNKLKEYLIKNLKDLGYIFSSDDSFIEFIKQRVRRLAFDENRNYYEFYLDFVNYDNRGTFIGSYSDKVDFSFKGNTVTATIGITF